MEIKINISSVKEWYRESTKEWVISIEYTVDGDTDSISGTIRFADKKLNRAKKALVKHLYSSIVEDFNFDNVWKIKNKEVLING